MLQYSDKDKKRWVRGWWPLALSVIIGSFKVAIEIFQWFDLRVGGISVLLAVWFFRCNDGGMWALRTDIQHVLRLRHVSLGLYCFIRWLFHQLSHHRRIFLQCLEFFFCFSMCCDL